MDSVKPSDTGIPAPRRSPSATYLDERQRHHLCASRTSFTWRTQWPTWLLIGAIYGSWFGIASHATRIGLPLAIPLLAVISAWYMSLQHELLHGHPTRFPTFNALFGFAPLAVWFPYAIYRRAHLAHHATPELTDPETDPESFFVSKRAYLKAPRVIRMLWAAHATFAGRVLIGPVLTLASTLFDTYNRIRRGDLQEVPAWTAHALALIALASWLDRQCAIPPLLFLAGVGYPALSIALIRSFREHRYHPDPALRTVINHASWPWRLLFLNNTLHAVHHNLPSVPWFALPAVYRRQAAQYEARNAGYVVRGYGEWWHRFAFTPVDHVATPGSMQDSAEPRGSITFARPAPAANSPIPSDLIGAPLP